MRSVTQQALKAKFRYLQCYKKYRYACMLQLLCTNEYVNQKSPGISTLKSEAQQLAQTTTKLDANSKQANEEK
jgi:hypothetical protein